MQRWLIRKTPTFPVFSDIEIDFILKYTNNPYKIEIPDPLVPLTIVTCTKLQIDNLVHRSVFVKSVSYLENISDIINFYDTTVPKTAKIDIISYNNPINLSKRKEIINENLFLISSCKINLENPDFTLQIFITKALTYTTLLYKESKRKEILKYRIANRPLIGITCMDWELSIFMANLCGVNNNSLVIDPFIGSGGIALACAWFDSTILGIDCDKKALVGTNERKGNVKTSLKGNTIYDNFKFIGKEGNVLGIFVSDIFKTCFGKKIKFDAVICDPPYGDRISLKGKMCFDYLVGLKEFSDVYLKKGGCVCFWAPFYEVDEMDILFAGFKREINVQQKLGTVDRTVYLYRK